MLLLSSMASKSFSGIPERLTNLLYQRGNETCADCSEGFIPANWASVSHGIFLCIQCAGKHRGLGVQTSFVRSITMDRWSEIHLKKMEVAGGNNALNEFLAQYGIPKETDIVTKYNSEAAQIYREKVQALSEGRHWEAPNHAVQENYLYSGYQQYFNPDWPEKLKRQSYHT